jgi:hypothetical protein
MLLAMGEITEFKKSMEEISDATGDSYYRQEYQNQVETSVKGGVKIGTDVQKVVTDATRNTVVSC